MTKIDIKYLAGFFDGEGSIGLYKQKNCYHLTITITNTNLKILELIQEDYGGNINKTKKSGYDRNIFRLIWHGENAKELLSKIYDELFIKKQQAELMLCFPTIEQKMLQSFNKEIMEQIRSTQHVLYLELKKGK